VTAISQVTVGVCVAVGVAVFVAVLVAVLVAVTVGVLVAVDVAVFVDVFVAVLVAVFVAVFVAVLVAVKVFVGGFIVQINVGAVGVCGVGVAIYDPWETVTGKNKSGFVRAGCVLALGPVALKIVTAVPLLLTTVTASKLESIAPQ